jgi:ABC-2 type transport system permease protein
MPIFDQGYQHWDGQLSGHATRWLAITRQGIASQWKGWPVKVVVFTALIPALVLAGFLCLWGMLEQQSSYLEPFMFLFNGLPDEVRKGPKEFRSTYWTLAFHLFFNIEIGFTMFLVLLVGPRLISQDLRFNAIPLYLSRPLRRIDYFLGKLAVIGFFVGSVTLVPAVVAYLLGVTFSADFETVRETGFILVASIVYSLIVIVSAGTLILAISSLSKKSWVVGASWVGVWMISLAMGAILTGSVKRDWCPAVAYTDNLLRIREALIDTPAARTKLLEVLLVQQQRARMGVLGSLMLNRGPGRRGRNTPVGKTAAKDAAPSPLSNIPPGALPPALPGQDAFGNPAYSWQLSASVLAGLFVLSVWTLSSRVKSLDRLK